MEQRQNNYPIPRPLQALLDQSSVLRLLWVERGRRDGMTAEDIAGRVGLSLRAVHAQLAWLTTALRGDYWLENWTEEDYIHQVRSFVRLASIHYPRPEARKHVTDAEIELVSLEEAAGEEYDPYG